MKCLLVVRAVMLKHPFPKNLALSPNNCHKLGCTLDVVKSTGRCARRQPLLVDFNLEVVHSPGNYHQVVKETFRIVVKENKNLKGSNERR